MARLSADAEKALDRLRRDYASSLPRRLSALDAAWTLANDILNEDTFAELRKVVHSLAGGAGTFGYPDIGKAARALEERMDMLTALEPGQIITLTSLRDRLRTVMAAAVDEFRRG